MNTSLTASTFDTTSSDATTHVPFLCVEHDAIMEFVIMGASILFLVFMFAVILCMMCRKKAERDRQNVCRIKKLLEVENEDDDEECEIMYGKDNNDMEEVQLGPIPLSRRSIQDGDDYSMLEKND